MDILPSTQYHTDAVKAFNQQAMDSGWQRAKFVPELLMRQAKEQTQLEKFDDESFIPALEKLTESLNNTAELNPFGEMVVMSSIIEPLKTRLRADHCFRLHPEILDYPIENPVCIIGPHRSGTTRMHRMMAEDSRLQYLATWEGMNPAPYLDLPDFGAKKRYDEITGFLSFSFLGNSYIPEFYQYFLQTDKSDAYAYMVKLMQLISWTRKDPPGKRWLLKNPQHMLDLPTLNKVLPGIKMIFPHRDPLKTVGSVISLMWLFCRQNTDAPRRLQMKEIWWDYCQQSARRALAARANLPAEQQLDVYYQDINHNWKEVMRKVYDFITLPFDAAAEQSLQAWLDASEKEAHHVGHAYALEDFGLTTSEVETGMQFVRERYNIPFESSKRPQ